MSDFTPTPGEVRDSLVYLNEYHAKQFSDVDLMVVGSETVAQFDRMIAEVERKAAEKSWEEGYEVGYEDQQYRDTTRPYPLNPYRREETE